MPNDTSKAQCPQCYSTDIASIRYGKQAMTVDLKNAINAGKIILGGCTTDGKRMNCHCNMCQHQWHSNS